MSGTDKLLPKTWKKELEELKAESAKIKHDLAENDAILGELAEIADKTAMVQRTKAQFPAYKKYYPPILPQAQAA